MAHKAERRPLVTDGVKEGNPSASISNAEPLVRQGRSGGSRHRRKGDRREREIVERHRAINVFAERYPLSGASRFRGAGHDVDVYIFGRDEAPAVAEVKGRKSGAGFITLEKWLGEYDALFLRRDHAEPLVLLPWKTWAALLGKVRP